MKATGWIVLVALSTALAAAAGAGELKGTVKVVGARNNADAVVYVDSIAGKTFPIPKEHAVMNQKDLVFAPHVLPVLAGTTVDFLNSDAVLHNVFSPDKCCDAFNLGSWPQGQTRSYTFKNICVSTLLCKVHPEMEGYILSLPTPYFAVTDKAGAYVIKDLPDGKYTVKVWHQKVKNQAVKPVEVSGPTTADFTMTK